LNDDVQLHSLLAHELLDNQLDNVEILSIIFTILACLQHVRDDLGRTLNSQPVKAPYDLVLRDDIGEVLRLQQHSFDVLLFGEHLESTHSQVDLLAYPADLALVVLLQVVSLEQFLGEVWAVDQDHFQKAILEILAP